MSARGRPERPNPSNPTRTGRVVARLAAQVGVLVILGGVPYALYRLAGNPWPSRLPDLDQLRELLTTRDDGTLFLHAIAVAGWLGWASFVVPLLIEIPYQLAGRQAPRLLGLAWQQRRAAALVAVAISVAGVPAVASASAITVDPTPAGAATVNGGGARTPLPAYAHASVGSSFRPTRVTITARQQPTYAVARGDWLFYVAERFLGDGDRYPEIAALNADLEHADSRFPDHIEAGQHLRLPSDAHDRRPRPHATGALVVPATPPPRPDTPIGPPNAGTATPPAPGSTPPSPTAPTSAPSTPSSPTTSSSPVDEGTGRPSAAPNANGSDTPPQDDSESAIPVTAAFATAGLLAALLLLRLVRQRRRQRRHRRPGRRVPQPHNPSAERQVRVAAQPVDVQRLDHALRAMAVGLSTRGADDLPDIAAAWLAGGEVHAMLTQPDHQPPHPFKASDSGMSWHVTAGAALPDVDDVLAPLPALVTVASKPDGQHLLIDLERTGLLTVGGDAERSADILRYVAAELATNQWSDDAEVILAGFDASEVDDLMAIGGARVRAAQSVSAAIERAYRRVAANAAALADSKVPTSFAGRVTDVVADAWMPHVLLIAAVDVGDEDKLRELEDELKAAGRCAVAVIALTSLTTTWRIDVSAAGKVAIDWLSITDATATRLPREQLSGLASVMRTARTNVSMEEAQADEAVPPATETDSWADGTDVHGHLIADESDSDDLELNGAATTTDDAHNLEGGERMPEPARSPGHPATSISVIDAARLVTVKAAAPRRRAAPHDPELDGDIDAWHRPDPHRPRISILGPVIVEAPGEPPDERQRFYSELVVYLAQRASTGATGEQIDDALWPERGVDARSRRVAISKVRRWLGENADGAPWLPLNLGSDRRYRLIPGVLIDWQLFRRLRARGEARGAAGATDLRRALELVRGEPLAGAELPYASGYRNPYTWLPGSDVQPHNLASAVVDTSHQLVELCLAAGDTAGARWAVERAWLADPERLDDHPWIDAMRVARADGRTAELRTLFDDLVRAREVEVPEDLPVATYAAVHELLRDVLRVG